MKTKNAECIPATLPVQLVDIPISCENISDFLSIVGANANAVEVRGISEYQKEKVFGYIGCGPTDAVFRCSTPSSFDGFIKLDTVKHARFAMAILNVVYPHAFENEEESSAPCKKELILNAVFAQYFISEIEGVNQGKAEHCAPSQYFALLFRGGGFHFADKSGCYDETDFFRRNIWTSNSDGSHSADFEILLKDEKFKEKNGCLFAIVPDNKLLLHKKAEALRQLYSEKFGNYECDRTMSEEDWADLSALNATISEAESYQLEIEGPGYKELKEPTEVTYASADEERHEMFIMIQEAEKDLLAQQKKFEYSLIPGKDVDEARTLFFAKIRDQEKKKTPMTFPRRSTRTPLRVIEKTNARESGKAVTEGRIQKTRKPRSRISSENSGSLTPKRAFRFSRI